MGRSPPKEPAELLDVTDSRNSLLASSTDFAWTGRVLMVRVFGGEGGGDSMASARLSADLLGDRLTSLKQDHELINNSFVHHTQKELLIH